MQVIGTLLLVLMLMTPHAWCADRRTPLSVCELIAHRAEYNGRMVSVRGVVAGGEHGIWLEASRECSYQLVTRGVVWPNVINLVHPLNRSRDVYSHAPFKLDWKAVQRADADALAAGYRAGVDVMVETIVGLFVTFPDLEKRVNPGIPGAFPLGFGPVGLSAPAQLVIKTVKDVSVTHGGMNSQTGRPR